MQNQPDGWKAFRGISGCGLYFVMCERDDPELMREFRIFWYRISSKNPRWFRSQAYDSQFEAGLHMTRLANGINLRGHANEFIEDQSKKRREFIQWKLERRDDMQRLSRERRRMTTSPTYGLF